MQSEDIYNLNLPIIHEGEEPLPLGPPTYEAQMAHARFLIRNAASDFWEKRLARMNPEPFRLD